MNKAQTNFLTTGTVQMFLSTFAFAMANVFVKKVSHIPVTEVLLFRCLIAGAFCLIGLRRAQASYVGSNRMFLVSRGFFGTLALVFFFLTIQNMPLATAMTVQYLSPIFTAIIAIFFLKESVRPVQWLFYAIAFAGVLLIGQIDSRVSFVFIMFGIISAFGSGAAYNLVRKLRDKEHPLTIILYFQVCGILVGVASIPFAWETPLGTDWIYLLLIGIFSQAGQVFLTNAFGKEKAASVAIIVYSGLIYGISIGWIFFGEAQTILSLLGMCLVVAGVVSSVLYGRRRQEIERVEASVG